MCCGRLNRRARLQTLLSFPIHHPSKPSLRWLYDRTRFAVRRCSACLSRWRRPVLSVMRSMWRSACLKAIVVLSVLAPTTAAAQGFFESLFGGGGQTQPAHVRPPQAPPVPPIYGYRAPPFNPYRTPSQHDDDGATQSRAGHYQTMCVRMCDGYYFPISNGVSRSTFHRDANRCRSSCGEEARLFYRPSSEPDAGQMVDLTGRVYSKLPNAFKYRKSLVQGCKCKPEPWSVSEMDRHRRYALNETIEQQKQRQRSDGEGETPDAKPANGEPKLAEITPEKAEPADEPAQPPAEVVQPVESPKPRTRRAEARPPAPREPLHRAALAKPVSALPSAGPFGNGFGGGSKLRWPGD